MLVGHVGDGNFHDAIMFNRNDMEQVAKAKKVVYDQVDRALKLEGSCTVRFCTFRSENGRTLLIY